MHNLFSSNRKKEGKRIGKNGEEITKCIPYKLKFVDCARFLASLLSNLANNLDKIIHKIKCKYGDDKN